MKARKYFIFVVMTFLLISCQRGYEIENGKVYYKYWNEGSGQKKKLLKMADAETFQIIAFDEDNRFYFGKDKNHLYIDGELIRNIDPNTFRLIGNYVFADKDSAYFFGFYNNIHDCAIKGIKLNELQLIKYPWSKAENTLIYGYQTLILDDIDDFVPIDEDWGKTKKYVINRNTMVTGADPVTFKVISERSGKDKNNTYEYGKIKK